METNEMTMTEAVCQDCGGALGPGRNDKKFCSNECRTNFNNRKKKDQQQQSATEEMSVPDYIRRIQEIQLKNRSIMESLNPEEKPRHIRMRDLLGKGFNPKFFTSEADPTEAGNVYRFCFEYGYWLDGDVAIVVHREREVL